MPMTGIGTKRPCSQPGALSAFSRKAAVGCRLLLLRLMTPIRTCDETATQPTRRRGRAGDLPCYAGAVDVFDRVACGPGPARMANCSRRLPAGPGGPA